MALGVSLGTHIALACGFITSLFPGFAKADDVTSIRTQIVAMRQDTLQGEIMSVVHDQCLARDQKNIAAENSATYRLLELKREYRSLAGREPDTPQCWELP